MTSKEEKYEEWRRYFFEVDKEMYEYFIQDLERLEVLEKLVTDDCIAGNQIGLTIVNSLITKNKKLEKAFDKAIEKCMKFDKCPPITCIEIYGDNDNVCKECWKKYFMKEALENE